MTDTFKILAQTNPGAAALTDSYTVPASTQTVVSTILVTNRSSVTTSFRISLAANGAANDNAQYLYFDTPIAGNDTFSATLGVTLDAADVLRVYATLATLTFQIFGVEVTA